MSMKIVDYAGLATLSAYMKQVKKMSDGNTSDIETVRKELQELASSLVDVLAEVGDCIETLDSEKAYIAARKDFTLAVSGWVTNTDSETNTEYPYMYQHIEAGVTAETRVDAVLDENSSLAAGIAGMSPNNESMVNAVVFRSKQKPTVALTGQLYFTQGASETTT